MICKTTNLSASLEKRKTGPKNRQTKKERCRKKLQIKVKRKTQKKRLIKTLTCQEPLLQIQGHIQRFSLHKIMDLDSDFFYIRNICKQNFGNILQVFLIF